MNTLEIASYGMNSVLWCNSAGILTVTPSSVKMMVGGNKTLDSETREAVNLRYIRMVFGG